MRRAVRTLLITTAVMVLTELCARLLLDRYYDRHFPVDLVEPGRYGSVDGPRPGAAGTVWGVDFNTDGSGGRSTGQVADTASRYWLYLGDSVGEGVGVADSACAVSIIARGTPGLRVMNLCHIGYTTCDELEVLRRWTDTCVVVDRVTVLFTLNDAYGRSNTDELPPLRTPGATATLRAWLQQHVAIYRGLKLLLLRNADHYYRYDRAFYRPEDPRLATTLKCLDALSAICVERHIALDLTMIPYRSQVDGTNDAVPQEMMQQACAARNIPFTDALPALRRAGEPASLYLFADEIHLSALGHAALADILNER